MRQADPLQIHAPQVAAVKHRIRKIPAADRKARQIGPGKTAAAAIAALHLRAEQAGPMEGTVLKQRGVMHAAV